MSNDVRSTVNKQQTIINGTVIKCNDINAGDRSDYSRYKLYGMDHIQKYDMAAKLQPSKSTKKKRTQLKCFWPAEARRSRQVRWCIKKSVQTQMPSLMIPNEDLHLCSNGWSFHERKQNQEDILLSCKQIAGR